MSLLHLVYSTDGARLCKASLGAGDKIVLMRPELEFTGSGTWIILSDDPQTMAQFLDWLEQLDAVVSW